MNEVYVIAYTPPAVKQREFWYAVKTAEEAGILVTTLLLQGNEIKSVQRVTFLVRNREDKTDE